jgi:hypothetical protein
MDRRARLGRKAPEAQDSHGGARTTATTRNSHIEWRLGGYRRVDVVRAILGAAVLHFVPTIQFICKDILYIDSLHRRLVVANKKRLGPRLRGKSGRRESPDGVARAAGRSAVS